ncbi:MAG: phage head-tail connector protein [Paracoccaceae bacterium]
MDLQELEPVATAALPLDEFRAHLRLGTGFADDTSTDALLERYLRAALATIEARTGKTLFSRRFLLVLPQWRWPDAQAFPLAPVSAIETLEMRETDGNRTPVTAGWRLVPDWHRPQIVATGATLPSVPTGAMIEVTMLAGFSATWAGLPDDLRQAVLLLAAIYYEGRSGGAEGIPASVESLLARWKSVRIGAGRVL